MRAGSADGEELVASPGEQHGVVAYVAAKHRAIRPVRSRRRLASDRAACLCAARS
jgi:hypothetical protein